MTRDERYYHLNIVSPILALFGIYRISWYQGNIAIFIRYLNLSRYLIFSVLDDRLLSDTWVISRSVNLEELIRTYTSIQILLQAWDKYTPFVAKRTIWWLGAFCRETRYVKFTRFFRRFENIVYRVHNAIFAKYCVHIARALQKDIAHAWSRRYNSGIFESQWHNQGDGNMVIRGF